MTRCSSISSDYRNNSPCAQRGAITKGSTRKMKNSILEALPKAFLSEGEPNPTIAKFKSTRENKWRFPSAASLDDTRTLAGMLYSMDRFEEVADITSFATKDCCDSKSASSEFLCFDLGLIAFRLAPSTTQRESILSRLRKRQYFQNINLDFLSSSIQRYLNDVESTSNTKALRFISARTGFGLALSWLTVEEAQLLHKCERIPYAELQTLLDRSVTFFRDYIGFRPEGPRLNNS